MELELRFFATFREAVGRKTIERSFDDDARVGDVLAAIETEFPELVGEILESGDDGDDANGDEAGYGEIRPQLSVLKNGREVVHIDGTATELEDGDRLSVFPPVAGG